MALVLACLSEAIPQSGGRRGGGRGKPKPCDSKENIDECTCEDGETYSGRDIKRNCRKNTNPIVECSCVDGTTWTPPEKPCGSRENLDECECEDGEFYSGRSIKRNCKPDDNPIVECSCEDGTTWTPPRE